MPQTRGRRKISRQVIRFGWGEPGLGRLADLDSERMHPSAQLLSQRFHDFAVLGDSRFAGERIGNDSDAEMRLATRPRSRMPLMSCAFVHHFKRRWGELGRKFCN